MQFVWRVKSCCAHSGTYLFLVCHAEEILISKPSPGRWDNAFHPNWLHTVSWKNYVTEIMGSIFPLRCFSRTWIQSLLVWRPFNVTDTLQFDLLWLVLQRKLLNTQCLFVSPFLNFSTASVFGWQNTWHLKSFQKHYSISHISCAASRRKKWTIAKLPHKTTSKTQLGFITSRRKSPQQPQNIGTCTTTVWTNLNVFFLLDNWKVHNRTAVCKTQGSFPLFSFHITLTLIMFRLCITADSTEG